MKLAGSLHRKDELYCDSILKSVLEMNTFIVFLLVFLMICSESSSSSIEYSEEYLKPKSVDLKSAPGRWYEHMSTLGPDTRDNSYSDLMLLCDDTTSFVWIISRWIPYLKECRTTPLKLQFDGPNSPRSTVSRISTKEIEGTSSVHYYDPHPINGIALIHQHTQQTDGYRFVTRQKEPCGLEDVIKKIVEALHLNMQDFYVKSKNFGCELNEEMGVTL